jgi:hypothetical protein
MSESTTVIRIVPLPNRQDGLPIAGKKTTNLA